jgi:hypothetical protein
MHRRVRRTLALFFAVLMVATPAGTALAHQAPTNTYTPSPADYNSEFYRGEALSILEQASLPGNNGQRAQTALESTQRAYVGPNRINQSVFEADRKVVAWT